MPRLLLVDDNPSIHRIAESLLAPTDVVLVCVDSAAEALDRIANGERFDVALVDTAMPGMDGWTLLERLRALEATAQIPIALMAGVLDPVDPAKLAKASIQGFLKKPIELRELGDRVKALLATPVPPPAPSPSPFATVPATPARDLVRHAEEAFPERRLESAPTPIEVPGDEDLLDSAFGDLTFLEDGQAGSQEPALVLPEEDLLILMVEDLWPEATVPALPESKEETSAPAQPDMHLELEELDLDLLQDLNDTLEPEPALAAPAVEPIPESLPDLLAEDAPESAAGLEPPVEALPEPPAPAPAEPSPAFLAKAALAASSAGLAAMAGLAMLGKDEEAEQPAVAPEPAVQLPTPEIPVALPTPEPEAPAMEPPAAVGHATAAPGQSAPVSSEQAQALVQALLADPVLVDALVKAVVARMGDQVIREIAWEVMPDLAGRLQR